MTDNGSWNEGKTEGTYVNSKGTGDEGNFIEEIVEQKNNPIILDSSLVTCFAIESKIAKADHLSRYSLKSIKDALRHLKSYTECVPDDQLITIYRSTLNHIFKEEEVMIIDLLSSHIRDHNL